MKNIFTEIDWLIFRYNTLPTYWACSIQLKPFDDAIIVVTMLKYFENKLIVIYFIFILYLNI